MSHYCLRSAQITSQDIRSKTNPVKGDFKVGFSQQLLKCCHVACGYQYMGEFDQIKHPEKQNLHLVDVKSFQKAVVYKRFHLIL